MKITHDLMLGMLLLGVMPGCVGDNVVGSVGDPKAPAAPAQGLQVSMGPFKVPPGSEVQLCRTLKLSNDEPMSVDRIQIIVGEGTHHTNVFRSSLAYDDQVFPCWNMLSDDWELMATANRSGGFDWTLPNAAFRLDPHQQILILSHYVNATTVATPLGQGYAYVNLYETTDPSLAVAQATTIVNSNLVLPPHSQYSSSRTCIFDRSVFLFGLTGHFHSRGRELTVDLLGGPPDHTVGDRIYATDSWDEPTFLAFPNPALFGDGTHGLSIPAGEGLRFSCSYFNDTDETIGFGPHADTQEHCNLVLFYSGDGDTPLRCGAGEGW